MKKSSIQILSFFLLFLLLNTNTFALNPSGDLKINIITAYNLIVDSNIESPAGNGPTSFHIGVQICNTGTNPITDATVFVGNFAAQTPGIYPTRTISSGLFTGTFSFTHEGGLSDATRYVGTIAPGECITQYWLVSYPVLDAANHAVFGANTDPSDDLFLNYDVWAKGNDAGTQLTANDTRKMNFRNEITAMANKIWPNTTSKVPSEYITIVEENLGWHEDASSIPVGATSMMKGIWYDMGTIRHGFDNDGNFTPDFNFWVQPIGNPALYDATIFRLVRTSGLIIVKKNDGTKMLIPFTDRLYFENMPQDNVGAVGFVNYEFAALNGAFTGQLTPYQEAASGYDNEKFNADYGTNVGGISSTPAACTFSKTASAANISTGNSITYTLSATNTGTTAIGSNTLHLSFVFQDKIPAGTTYQAGSAALNQNLPAGTSAKIMYSTDNGLSWTFTEPSPASSVTNLQWWLSNPLNQNQTASVKFSVLVPTSYPSTYVENIGGISIGNSLPFLKDTAYTFISGAYSIGDKVFADAGAGGGIYGNGIQDGTESGLANIDLSLYFDKNGNGVLESTDIFWATTSTNASGSYLFSNLPNGNYLVVVNNKDAQLPSAYGATTPITKRIALNGANNLTADFGFAPPLILDKNLVGTSPIYEGDNVTYTIDVSNKLYAAPASVTAWATSTTAGNGWTNPANAIAAPDNIYANDNFSSASSATGLNGTGFSSSAEGEITKVEVLTKLYVSQAITDDTVKVYLVVNGVTIASKPYPAAALNNYIGTGNVGMLTWNVTGFRAWSWQDLAVTTITVAGIKIGGPDGALFIDALGLKYSLNNTGDASTTLGVVPVTDTYDQSKLQYVSATPSPTSVNQSTGVITWNNVGMLTGGQTMQITTVFKALQPSNLASGDNVTNTASTSGATFLDGTVANNATDVVTVSLQNTGSVSGYAWNDLNNSGYGSPKTLNGFESGEPFLANVKMQLLQCTAFANNGTCNTTAVVQTVYTNTSGFYKFEGLRGNGVYKVVTDASALPGTQTYLGDPDDGLNGTGNGNTCGTGSGNVPCNQEWDNNAAMFKIGVNTWGGQSWDITNINFGYNSPAGLYGILWEDVNGNGVKEVEEPLFSNVTVELQSGSCVVGSTCPTVVTNASGYYEFAPTPVAGGTTYTLSVRTSTLTAGSTWAQTGETDGTINNSISQTLTPGKVTGSHDFGFRKTGTSTIGDYIYVDWNANGIQESNEEGISGIGISLYRDANSNGSVDSGEPLVATTTSNSTGSYLFSSLAAGNYVVKVNTSTVPSYYIMTNDPDEVGKCAFCNGYSGVTLAAASNVLTKDFGFMPNHPGEIGDQVWNDKDGDTNIDSGEPFLAGVITELWADLDANGTYALIRKDTSDNNGGYLFNKLPDGNYQIRISKTAGNVPIDVVGVAYSPTNSSLISGYFTKSVSISNGNTNLIQDFGFTNLATIGDAIFYDQNANGTQDWNEAGIPNVSVILHDCGVDGICGNGDDGADKTQVTDATGHYLFSGLYPKKYNVQVNTATLPAGVVLSADPSADGEPCSSPTAYGCDNQFATTVKYGTNFMGADFGYRQTLSIGDYIWFDANANGIQDALERGISGVTITLTPPAGVNIGNGAGIAKTTTSDFDGLYSFGFNSLTNGTYTISVSTPSGMINTYDGDATLNNQTTFVVSNNAVTSIGGTTCTNCSLNLDFGFKQNGTNSITGTICMDDNSLDGVCNTPASETELANLFVNLYTGSGTYLTTVQTNSNGVYNFSSLPAGSYVITTAKSTSELSISSLVTVTGNTPATSISQNGITIIQNKTIVGTGNNITNMDLAFRISQNADFGDLPTTYSDLLPSYNTWASSATVYLGSSIDADTSPEPSLSASLDSDDGISFTNIAFWAESNTGGELVVTTTGGGWLVGWIDFNNDGDFNDNGENIISQAVSSGSSTIVFPIPIGSGFTANNDFYSRFRLFSEVPFIPAVSYAGNTTNGEIEDYKISKTSVLPVNITHFDAKWKNKIANVNWEVSQEVNIKEYQVWRSIDNQAFGYIGSVNAEGKSFYEMNDTEALNLHAVTYYKLKTIDMNGSAKWSEMAELVPFEKTENSLKAIAFPNPATDKIQLTLEAANVNIRIYNTLGQMMTEKKVRQNTPNNLIEFNLTNWTKGVYFINVINLEDNEETSLRFIVE